MENSSVEISRAPVDFAPDGVPYAAILPPGYEQHGAMPLCLVLHGGGGSHQNLVDSKPIYDELWASGVLPPMVLASSSVSPLGFYLDHPAGKERWERFIAQDFIAHLRRTYKVRGDRNSTIISGISMGGHGSLRIAFRNPDRSAAVAALEPALDPALQVDDAFSTDRSSTPVAISAPSGWLVRIATQRCSGPTILPMLRLPTPTPSARAGWRFISKPATRMSSIFTTAPSFYIGCYGISISRTSTIWCAAPIMSGRVCGRECAKPTAGSVRFWLRPILRPTKLPHPSARGSNGWRVAPKAIRH
jgi:pimeloyl-ACP methyl ester carboxylesterase